MVNVGGFYHLGEMEPPKTIKIPIEFLGFMDGPAPGPEKRAFHHKGGDFTTIWWILVELGGFLLI